MQCNTHGSIVERDDALLGGAVTDFFPFVGKTLRDGGFAGRWEGTQKDVKEENTKLCANRPDSRVVKSDVVLQKREKKSILSFSP